MSLIIMIIIIINIFLCKPKYIFLLKFKSGRVLKIAVILAWQVDIYEHKAM